MGKVFVNVFGDGSAYVVPTYNLSDGEEFTIYSTPFEGATLEDIQLWTSYDEPIAASVTEELTMEYRSMEECIRRSLLLWSSYPT